MNNLKYRQVEVEASVLPRINQKVNKQIIDAVHLYQRIYFYLDGRKATLSDVYEAAGYNPTRTLYNPPRRRLTPRQTALVFEGFQMGNRLEYELEGIINPFDWVIRGMATISLADVRCWRDGYTPIFGSRPYPQFLAPAYVKCWTRKGKPARVLSSTSLYIRERQETEFHNYQN